MANYKTPEELNSSDLVSKFNELRVVSGKYAPYHDLSSRTSVSRRSDFKIGPDTAVEEIPTGEYPVLMHQPTREEFLEAGGTIVQIMRQALAADGFRFSADQRVLDFGCFTARLLRWFLDEARNGAEFWGVDIDAYAIDWVAALLTPPFNFAVTTTEPHLPFPDAYFDLVYAGSVFTHMTDLTDAWLLELRRVLNTDGRAYLTFNDQAAVRLAAEKWPGSYDDQKFRQGIAQSGVTLEDVNFICLDQTPYASVFYNRDYLSAKLSRLFRLKSITEEAFGWQTGYLVQKAPPRVRK